MLKSSQAGELWLVYLKRLRNTVFSKVFHKFFLVTYECKWNNHNDHHGWRPQNHGRPEGQMDFYSLISCDVGSGCLGPAAEMNYQVLPGLGQEEINDWLVMSAIDVGRGVVVGESLPSNCCFLLERLGYPFSFYDETHIVQKPRWKHICTR